MTADALIELLSEEIPARMQDKAREDLARLFTAELAKAGLTAAEIVTYATPRRLALIARGLPLATEPVSAETKGPKVGAPQPAIDGFLRKTGLTLDQLVERDGVWFAVVDTPGRATAAVLAEAIPAIIRAFPWPKAMRWGAASASTESLRWVRPLQGIVALLGDDVVPCDIDGIVSGRTTAGHRFHHQGAVTVVRAAAYADVLRAAHVIVDQEERRALIRAGAERAAREARLVLVPDEGLVNENSGLTELPVPLLGRFDAAFLEVPPEVIQLTARVNQKYFVCHNAGGKLANAFVCTANIVASDGGAAIIAGNQKVLAARLSDARFFWEQDLKVPLDDQAAKLSQIVFHEKLGTVADKVERVAKLARWLCEEGIISPLPHAGGAGGGSPPSQTDRSPAASPTPGPSRMREGDLADMAERAARLCKADLVTGMVGEFPELQGIMGGYYARAQGETDAVADAVRDHYKPVGQGDDVPTDPVTVAVSLADKLDTLVGFFGIGELPTGSRDPFALRRAALGILQIIAQPIRMNLEKVFRRVAIAHHFQEVARLYPDSPDHMIDYLKDFESYDNSKVIQPPTIFIFSLEDGKAELNFLIDRLKVQQREAGIRHDLIDAVFMLGGEDDLVRLLARVHALQAFVETPDGANLLAAYKRAANLLKAADAVDPAAAAPSTLLPAETALLTALDTAEPKATAAIAAEDFTAAMTALASLRAPIDAFFEGVMVNDPDSEKRTFRLNLLARFRGAVHGVADFSRIEG